MKAQAMQTPNKIVLYDRILADLTADMVSLHITLYI